MMALMFVTASADDEAHAAQRLLGERAHGALDLGAGPVGLRLELLVEERGEIAVPSATVGRGAASRSFCCSAMALTRSSSR